MDQVVEKAAATRDSREVNAAKESEVAFDPSKARPLRVLKTQSLFAKYQKEHPEVQAFNNSYGDVFKIPEQSKQVYAMKGFNIDKDQFFNDYQNQYNLRLGLYSKAQRTILSQKMSKIAASNKIVAKDNGGE